MGWFNKKKEEGIENNTLSLPDLPDSNSPDLDYSPPNTTTPDIPYPPENPTINPTYQIEDKPMTKEIEPAISLPVKEYINEPRPGMQKSRFVPVNTSQINKPLQNPIKPQVIPYETRDFSRQHPALQRPGGVFRQPVKPLEKRDEAVYIRLDKFQMTMGAFKEVKEKIKEIEDLLLRTKEIKAREDKEIEEWEREIESIKIKIESIDQEMFEQTAE